MSTMSWIAAPCDEPVKISKWKVRKGSKVAKGALLCIYETETTRNLKLKSALVGTVVDVLEKETDGFLPVGAGLVKMQPCTHPTVMKDMCAECGADLRKEVGIAGNRKEPISASVAMVHNIPELIISEEQALELGKADEERLLKTQKLVLLVDLDQTLIHTTNDNIPANLKDVYHFQLRHGNVLSWYHTRLRPKTEEFLKNISKMYELHICTFGSRMYAHVIAKFLDPEGKYFSHRILSRDECFNQNTKIANLKALFPCGDSMVCIIDDREDVWNYSPNLIHVKPYRFFQGTADINAPPGLEKQENDSEPLKHKVTISCSNSKNDEKNDIEKTEKDIEGNDKPDGQERSSNSSRTDEGSLTTGNSDSQVVEVIKIPEDSKSNIICGVNTEKDILVKKDNILSGEEEIKVDISSNETVSSGGNILESTDTSLNNPVDTSNGVDEKNMETNEPLGDTKEDKAESEIKENKTKSKYVDGNSNDEEEEIEWDDDDDYLFYLEDILRRIHSAFYEMKVQLKSKEENAENPSLKDIIPYVKRKVLKGVNVVFSGVFPTNVTLEKSRAYSLAKALGAIVQTNLIPRVREEDKKDATTHLVAARLGTVKVRTAQKHKHVKIVNPNWLWVCAERLERVDERLFPLNEDTSGSAFCESPDPSNLSGRAQKRKSDDMDEAIYDRVTGKRIRTSKNSGSSSGAESVSVQAGEGTVTDTTAGEKVGKSGKLSDTDSKDTDAQQVAASITSQRFSTTYNPLMAFSDDDIACMDKEVEDIMDEEGEDSEEDDVDRDARIRSKVLSSGDDDDSVSEDSLSGDFPHGWNIKKGRKSLSNDSASDNDAKEEQRAGDEESENELDKYEKTVAAFAPDTESDSRDSFAESIGSVDDEMAEAVEKEFLSQL